MSSATYCNTCGQQLESDHDQPDKRPCPNCGGLTRRYHEQLTISLSGSGAAASSGKGELTVTGGEPMRPGLSFPTGQVAAVEQPDTVEGRGTVSPPPTEQWQISPSRDYRIVSVDLPDKTMSLALSIDGRLVDIHLGDSHEVNNMLVQVFIEISDNEAGTTST